MSETDRTLSTLVPLRRDLLAATAGLLTQACPAGAEPPTASVDADLIACCRAYIDLERQVKATFDQVGSEARDEVLRQLWAAQGPLLDRMCAIRATTLEGMRARVRSILASSGGAAPNPAEAATWADFLTGSSFGLTLAVFRDLLGTA